jgi:chromosome segregation ATPase
MQKEQEKELAAIKERQRTMKEMQEKIERENKELKWLTKRLVEARKTQKKLNEEFAQLRQNENALVRTQAIVHSSAQQVTDSIKVPDVIENSDKGKPQSKKKENSPTETPVVVSDKEYDTGPEEDDYKITVDKCQDLFKALRNMV